MKTKVFKPIVLSVDNKRYDAIIEGDVIGLSAYNKALKETKEITMEPVKPEHIHEFVSDPIDYLYSQLRPKFQFPKAKDDFNLQVLGIDLNELLSIYKMLPPISHIEYDYSNGALTLSEGHKEFVLKSCSSITNSDKQNEVYHAAKNAAESLNKLIQLGYIDQLTIQHATNLCNLLCNPFGSGVHIEVDSFRILQIK